MNQKVSEGANDGEHPKHNQKHPIKKGLHGDELFRGRCGGSLVVVASMTEMNLENGMDCEVQFVWVICGGFI